MKNALYSFLIFLLFLFNGCKSATKASSDNYQPETAGSTWVYKTQISGGLSSKQTVTVDNETTDYKGKIYRTLSTKTDQKDSVEYKYFANSGNSYYYCSGDPATADKNSKLVEFEYLNDTYPVGRKYGVTKDAAKHLNSSENEIIEKDITRTVNGKAFNKVIHWRNTINMDMPTGDVNLPSINQTIVLDFYSAKGVGVIESEVSLSGKVTSKQILLSYDIK